MSLQRRYQLDEKPDYWLEHEIRLVLELSTYRALGIIDEIHTKPGRMCARYAVQIVGARTEYATDVAGLKRILAYCEERRQGRGIPQPVVAEQPAEQPCKPRRKLLLHSNSTGVRVEDAWRRRSA